jgi:hypothetical protein
MDIHRNWSGIASGIVEPGERLVQDPDAWQRLWRDVHRLQVPVPDAPAIDFDRHAVAGIFLGQKPTGGWSVGIEAITTDEHDVTVLYRIVEPPEDAMLAQMLTSPYALAQIDRPAGQVRFLRL